MAPVVLRTRNLRFIIYPKDHRPEHVHIKGPEAEAKIAIQTGEVISATGFSKKALKRLSLEVLKRKEHFLELWDEYEGEE